MYDHQCNIYNPSWLTKLNFTIVLELFIYAKCSCSMYAIICSL